MPITKKYEPNKLYVIMNPFGIYIYTHAHMVAFLAFQIILL